MFKFESDLGRLLAIATLCITLIIVASILGGTLVAQMPFKGSDKVHMWQDHNGGHLQHED